MISRLIPFLPVLFVGAALQAAAPPDDQARFLAGLSSGGAGELAPLEGEAAWQEHAAAFHRAWVDVEDRQLAHIHTWMPLHFPYIQADPSPLFYFFSGPDFLYASAFFPNASEYILCGREPVGTLPDVAALSAAARAGALRNLRHSLNAILSYSFFITADMKSDLANTQLSGTLPVLYLFLARAGCRITAAELVWLDAAGDPTQEKSKTPGVRIRFNNHRGVAQTLWYFTTDLSNWGIKDNPAFIEFCRQRGQGTALVKAASYLMHLDSFSSARGFLLEHSRHILQDDSGIPWRFFNAENWMTSLHGHYPGPINLFKQHFQRDLDTAFKTQSAGPLPFGAGYQWRPNVSSLIIATARRTVLRAIPVNEE
ncbi:MAG TPA: hypothetical protein PK490_13965 [Prosthecobacter sp.]|nr:hypothetical protein [Prosthecobacter sp.]HRK15382.1 hypothetical protein [Prosthecobacter sp.]